MALIAMIMDLNSRLGINGTMCMWMFRGRGRQCSGWNGRQELLSGFAGKTFINTSGFYTYYPIRYTVNGVDGWGVSEWEYRHKEGNKNKISSI